MILELQKPIKRAARAVAFQWPGVVEAADVEQDLYLFLLERPGSLEKIRDMEEAAQYRAIIGIGHQLASKERADYEVFSGNFRYSVSEVRRLLESGILEDLEQALGSSWSDIAVQNGDSVQDKVLSKVTMEQDLHRGMSALARSNGRYLDLIQRRYLYDEAVTGSDSQTLSRALASLATKMNRSFKRQHAEYDDGPGSRKAISNRAAQVISAQQYAGTYNDGRN